MRRCEHISPTNGHQGTCPTTHILQDYSTGTRASINQAGGRLTARSRQVSKPRDSGVERYDHYNIQSRGFETSWDLHEYEQTTLVGTQTASKTYQIPNERVFKFRGIYSSLHHLYAIMVVLISINRYIAFACSMFCLFCLNLHQSQTASTNHSQDTRSTPVNTMCWFNIKTPSCRYLDFHYKDETVVRPYYLCNGNFYTGKMVTLYWIVPSLSQVLGTGLCCGLCRCEHCISSCRYIWYKSIYL